jgi:hypothetical protein
MTSLPLPDATPEDVGLSTAGLTRLGSVMRGEIERGRVPGAVALVARRPAQPGSDGEGQHFPNLFDDQTHRVRGPDDVVGGRALPAQ